MAVDYVIQGITDYFMGCPLLKDGAFRINALGTKGIEYSVETAVFNPVVRRYVNGDQLMQYQFNFSSRELFSMDRIQNIQNSGFYEELADWVETQDRLGIFPELPEDCEAQSMSVLSSGYLFDASMKYARYQIQLQLQYIKEV